MNILWSPEAIEDLKLASSLHRARQSICRARGRAPHHAYHQAITSSQSADGAPRSSPTGAPVPQSRWHFYHGRTGVNRIEEALQIAALRGRLMLSVKRDASNAVVVEVEFMKDGAAGDTIASRLKAVEVGKDQDGEPITSCVIEPADVAPIATASEARLTPNQKTMFRILHAAGPRGLSLEDWYEQARSEGIGTNRRATLGDLRAALHAKGLVIETMNGWTVK